MLTQDRCNYYCRFNYYCYSSMPIINSAINQGVFASPLSSFCERIALLAVAGTIFKKLSQQRIMYDFVTQPRTVICRLRPNMKKDSGDEVACYVPTELEAESIAEEATLKRLIEGAGNFIGYPTKKAISF